MMPREPLSARACGRWPAILSAVGVPESSPRDRHGPCPMCGGKDRFRFDNKEGRGTWICSKCGAGDGIELVKRFLNLEFKQAAELIERHLGSAPLSSPARGRSSGYMREEIKSLWARSKLITPEDQAGRYLGARTGILEFPCALRFSPDERYMDPGSRPIWLPAMVAKVDPCDKAVAIGERASLHRTYLSPICGKAEVHTPRKMMGSMPNGAAVRLMHHEETLGIAEGIETALSASILHDCPCWAALNAELLAKWVPPEGVTRVIIFGDNDASSTGQAAAYTLAKRLKAMGLSAIVQIPGRTGDDWNDVHIRNLAADAPGPEKIST